MIQNLIAQLKKEVNKLTSIGLQPIILISLIVRIYKWAYYILLVLEWQ